LDCATAVPASSASENDAIVTARQYWSAISSS
jgi:hypothetical protein